MMTVGELKRLLADVDDSVWVCVKGDGPASCVVTELGANEPFLVVSSTFLTKRGNDG